MDEKLTESLRPIVTIIYMICISISSLLRGEKNGGCSIYAVLCETSKMDLSKDDIYILL